MSAQLQKITIGSILEIGGGLNPSTNAVEGDALFLIDYETFPPKLLVQIEGAVGIPILKTYGAVNISISDGGASLIGKVSVFDGALGMPSVEVRWDWAFSRFYLR